MSTATSQQPSTSAGSTATSQQQPATIHIREVYHPRGLLPHEIQLEILHDIPLEIPLEIPHDIPYGITHEIPLVYRFSTTRLYTTHLYTALLPLNLGGETLDRGNPTAILPLLLTSPLLASTNQRYRSTAIYFCSSL